MGTKRREKLFLVLSICLINFGLINAKPMEEKKEDVKSALDPEGRRVGLTSSWDPSGMWSGSARLPPASLNGGNSQSRDMDMTRRETGEGGRRLTKWGADKIRGDEEKVLMEEDPVQGNPLTLSLSAMANHLMSSDDDKQEDSLENSSERDVYLTNNEEGVEESPEEAEEEQEEGGGNGTTPKSVTPSQGEESESQGDEEEDPSEASENREKSDNPNPSQTTTNKGLTTWSAVNGGKGKVPSDYTISSALSFSEGSSSSSDLSIKEDPSRTSFIPNPTTEIPRTTKSAAAYGYKKPLNILIPPKIRKPYNKNKKIVLPNKFVKPALEEVEAEAIGTDATHTIYKINSASSSPASKLASASSTRKPPQWPYQLTTPRRVLSMSTRRPAFSKITVKPNPKIPYVKRPNAAASALSLTLNPMTTTTTQASTTTYLRQPAPLMYPFSPISFTNLGFMDFLRSQIIPRIGLSLISFMAASPLILSMLGASAVGRKRRKKRDINLKSGLESAKFESFSVPKELTNFDFSAIKKKLSKLQNNDKQSKKPKSLWNSITQFAYQKLSSDPKLIGKLLTSFGLSNSPKPTPKKD